MSFALTTEQVRNRSKTVTRRMNWLRLKAGEEFQAVRKCMGLKAGEKVEPLAVLRVVSVRREKLIEMDRDPMYGQMECVKEGFADSTPLEFIEMFCRTHKGCGPQSEVTRIEFEYSSGS